MHHLFSFQVRIITLLLSLSTGFILFSNDGHAQTSLSGLIINADDYEYDSVNKKAILTGKVQVVWNGNHLSAAKAEVDLVKKIINAQGDVILQNSKLHAEADRIEYNYDEEKGFFYNSFIQSGQVVFEGEVIEKTGAETFLATRAKYTSCETCPGAWSFSGKRIEAELGGYAWITRPILRVGGVPILILPGLVVPLKSKRQSGLLVPSYNISRLGGSAISQSYFWAVTRNKDFTFTARNYEKRGFMSIAEYRYVLSEKSHGQLNTAHIRDKQFNNQITKKVDRWFFSYKHVYEMPDNLVHRVNLTAVSDLRYPTDFPLQVDAIQDPAIENTMSLSKTSESQFASIEGAYNLNLLKSDILGDNTDAVHRLPEISYHAKTQRIFGTSLLGKFELNYTNFTRSGLSYDDIEPYDEESFLVSETRDGTFNPDSVRAGAGDLIRTGHRLDIQPSISLPFQVGQIVDILPRVTYRETQYRFQIEEGLGSTENFSRSAARRYLQTDITARTQFGRVFGDLDDPKSARIRHVVEPEVSFSNIPWFKRADHGFFGEFAGQPFSQSQEPITDEDFLGGNGIQFDYEDRIFDRRIVSYGLTNKIVRKTWKYGQPEYEKALVARVGQSYDLNEASSDQVSQPWLPIDGLLQMDFENFETYTLARHYPYARRTNISSRLRLKNEDGDFLQMIYSKFIRINQDNELISTTETENIGAGLGLTTRFLNLYGEMNYSTIIERVVNWRFGTVIKPPGNCVQLIIGGTVVPNGDVNYDANVTFNFGGDR